MTRVVAPPKTLYVGTFEFLLHFVPGSDPNLEGANGITELEEGKHGIWIIETLPPRKMLEIVLHEITHAINWERDIKGAMRLNEEALARKHGEAWSAFWIDNPKFHRWHTALVNRIRKERKDA